MIYSLFSRLLTFLLDQEVQGDYTVTPVDKYVNNKNMSSVETTLSIKELEESKIARIFLVNEDGTLGSQISTTPSGVINIPAHTSKINLPKMDLSSIVNSKDGVYKFRLVEMSGTSNTTKVGTLAEFTLDARTKAMDTIKLLGLKGNRPASSMGSVSFSIQSEDNIVKAYYLKKVNSADTSDSITPSGVTDFGDLKEAKYIQVTNNKVVDASISLTDEVVYEDKTFDVYFIFEDEYGNVSTTVCTQKILIPWEKDGDTKLAPAISEAKITDVSTVNEKANVQLTWKLAEGETIESNKFTVVLYKDGRAIDEKTSIATLSTTLDQFSSVTSLEAGTYYFEVYTEGNGKILPSSTIKSNETTVSKLNAVKSESIKFDVDKYNKSVLTWDASTSPAEDIKDYKIELYGYSTSSKKYDSKVTVTDSPVEETKAEGLASMSYNTLYKANVTTEAKGNKLSIVDSDESVSKEFFKVYKPVIQGTAGSNTVTFKITTREVSGMTPAYKVKVFLYNAEDPNGLFDGKYKEDTTLAQDVTVRANGTFDVKGLQPGTQYVIRLYATVNGIEGVSEYSNTVSTKLTIPNITEKKVVADGTSASATKVGEIAKTTNGISVDGKEYKTSEYPAELAEIQAIVDKLVEGDVLTYTSNAVTVKLGAFGTSDTSRNRDLETTLGSRDLYLINGNYSQVVKGTVGGNVIISGNNESLDITGLTSDKEIKINAGSTIKGATKVVVVANENETPVNFTDKKLKINVSADTTIDVSTSSVNITATPNNNITLNSTLTSALNVVINGDGTDTNIQSGKLNITAKGDVTVSAESLAFSADITANVTDGNVDLSGTNLSGSQNVIITNTTSTAKTIKVKVDNVAPFEITNAIDIKEHAISELSSSTSTLSKAVSGLYNTDQDKKAENLSKLNAYLSKFTTLYGTTYGGTTKYGAKITEAKGNIVTISLNKTVDDRENQVSVNI